MFAKLEAAGFVIVGKTNTPELGLMTTTEPQAYGPTHNPWDTTRTPGGSSGGSAAAVASGMVPLAHAGDGGGSIRIPSSMCGLFGLKPSRGPRLASVPSEAEPWGGFVMRHVVTRSVRDSAAVLDVLEGYMTGDPVHRAAAAPAVRAARSGADPGQVADRRAHHRARRPRRDRSDLRRGRGRRRPRCSRRSVTPSSTRRRPRSARAT